MRKLILNQNGISLVEVMVAAGISSVIALGTMKINENAQKGMRSVATKAELSSYLSQRFPNALQDNGICLAAWDINNDNAPGDVVNLVAGNDVQVDGVYANGTALAELNEVLPATSGEFVVADLRLLRNNDTSCELLFNLSRNDGAASNKLGGRDKAVRVPLACAWNGANVMISCSTESTSLGRWDYDTIGGVEWLENSFKSAVIGDYDTAGPNSPFPPARITVVRNDAVSTNWSGALEEAIGLPENYVLRWGNERAVGQGVGLWGEAGCIRFGTAADAATPFLTACNAAGTSIRNGLTVQNGGLTVSGGGANIIGNTSIGGNISATGTATVAGATNLMNSLTVAGPATVNNTFRATGNSTFDNNVTVGNRVTTQTLDVVQDADIGTNAVIGQTTTTRDLVATRDTNVGRDLSVTRDTNLGRHLTVSNNLSVGGNTTLNGTLTVNSNTTTRQLRVDSASATIDHWIHTGGTAKFMGGFKSMDDSSVTGNLWVSGTVTSSDANLKEEIRPIDQSLENILSLHPVRYFWKDRALRGETEQFGFIAQEVQQVYPELVAENKDDNYLGVNYVGLIAPIVDSIKALYFKVAKAFSGVEENKREIASIKEENKKLKEENEELKARVLRIEKTLKFK